MLLQKAAGEATGEKWSMAKWEQHLQLHTCSVALQICINIKQQQINELEVLPQN